MDLVNGWVEADQANSGVLLQAGAETDVYSLKKYNSAEAGANIPNLEVTYRPGLGPLPPVPSVGVPRYLPTSPEGLIDTAVELQGTTRSVLPDSYEHEVAAYLTLAYAARNSLGILPTVQTLTDQQVTLVRDSVGDMLEVLRAPTSPTYSSTLATVSAAAATLGYNDCFPLRLISTTASSSSANCNYPATPSEFDDMNNAEQEVCGGCPGSC